MANSLAVTVGIVSLLSVFVVMGFFPAFPSFAACSVNSVAPSGTYNPGDSISASVSISGCGSGLLSAAIGISNI